MLFDPYGREIRALPVKPQSDMIGTIRVRDQWTSYPSNGLTPEKLAGILREADLGHVERQAELFEEMEEKDPDLMSLFQTRKLAVQGLSFEISPASDSAEDQTIAEAVKENIDDLDLDDPLLDLLDAIAKGFAAIEIQWDVSEGGAWVTGFEWIHQKRFTFTEFSAAWQAPLPKVPRLLTDDEPIKGVDIPPFKIIYHRYKARSGFAQRAGLMRTVAYYYLFKNYDIKDWIIFLERFGQPLRLGKFTHGASDDDKKVLKQAIQSLGVDAGAMISDTTMLDILEAKTTQASSDLYSRAAEFFNKSYAKCILGQTATTEGTPGKLGNDQAQSDVRKDLVEADAKAIAKTLRQQLIWPMVGFNFGWDKPLPKLQFQIEEAEDLQALSTTHLNLVQMGMPIPLSYAQKKYGIPAPADNEDVLTAPQQQQPFSPGAGFPNAGANNFSPMLLGKKKRLVPIGSRLVGISD